MDAASGLSVRTTDIGGFSVRVGGASVCAVAFFAVRVLVAGLTRAGGSVVRRTRTWSVSRVVAVGMVAAARAGDRNDG